MRPFPAFISPANRTCACMLCLTCSFNSCQSGTTTTEQKKKPHKPKRYRRMETYTEGGRCGLSLLLFVLQTVPVLACCMLCLTYSFNSCQSGTTTTEQKWFYKLRSCLRISKENRGLRFGDIKKICDKEWAALAATDKENNIKMFEQKPKEILVSI